MTEQKQSKRDLILELAEEAVLQKGFAATSIDELIAAAGITKSGFFYHFKDKSDLAKHMYLRYLERDNQIFEGLFKAAEEHSDDPLDILLTMIEKFAAMLEEMPTLHPGCLVASYTYQHQLFNNEIRDLNKVGVLKWRQMFQNRLEAIADKYPPAEDVDLEALADLVTTLVEGGIVMSKSLDDKNVLPQQLMMYHDYIQRIFRPQG